MATVPELNIQLIHQHMLEHGEWMTPAAMAKRLGFHRVTVRAAFLYGLERGWYITRDHPKYLNPRTGGPATEYKAVPRPPS